jgi:hypothetical protein
MDGYPPTLISTRYTDTLKNNIEQERKMRKKNTMSSLSWSLGLFLFCF